MSQQGEIPYHQFFGNGSASILNTIHRFGEICVVAIHVAIMNKMQNGGKQCIWWGFADSHASNCYRH